MPNAFGQVRSVGAVAILLALAACASPPTDGSLIADPYESVNRVTHRVNKGLDTALIRPAAQAYVAATPTLVRFLIANGSAHLSLPVDAANHALQGELTVAAGTVGRFGVNTLFGAAGLLDPATEIGLPHERTDFGETLHVWGAGEGVYFELPLFGPSTTRDSLGRLVDTVINPLTYVTGSPESEVLMGLRGVEILELRGSAAREIDAALYDSEDSYISVKSTYVQFRRRQLAGGEARTDDALPDIFSDPPAQ